MKVINAGNKKWTNKKTGFYFVSVKRRGVIKVKAKLKTYEVNTSVNCIKYEGTCLRGKRPNTAGENNLQMIDRSFLSRLPTQSTSYLDFNREKYFL